MLVAALSAALLVPACHDDPPAAEPTDQAAGLGLCDALGATVGEASPGSTPSTRSADGADLVVYVTAGASDDEVRAIGDELRRSWADVTYVDRDATYAEFTERFADRPEVAKSMTPDLLPTSYRVRIGAGEPAADQALVDALGARAGVDGVVRPGSGAATAPAPADQLGLALVVLWYPDPFDIVVQLAPDAQPGDIGPIIDAVSAVGEGLTVLSGEDLYRQLQTTFGDQPGSLAGVTPELLGGSVRADVSRRVDLGDVEQLASVRGITYRYDDPIADALVDALATTPGIVDRLRSVDDPLAADLLVLVDAAVRWSGADPETRTRGAVFDSDERSRIAEAAGRVARGALQRCGTNFAALADALDGGG